MEKNFRWVKPVFIFILLCIIGAVIYTDFQHRFKQDAVPEETVINDLPELNQMIIKSYLADNADKIKEAGFSLDDIYTDDYYFINNTYTIEYEKDGKYLTIWFDEQYEAIDYDVSDNTYQGRN